MSLRRRLRDAWLAFHDSPCDCQNQDALEVLCRVFDDGADHAYYEWLKWYDPKQWLNSSRALGAFIRMRLERKGWKP